MKKKINIYLLFYKAIAGGYKVIYQYSNYLAEKGYDVTIYYDLMNGTNQSKMPKWLCIIYRKIFLLKYPYYIKLNRKIKQKGIKQIRNNLVRNADISIATSPKTAFELNSLDNKKGEKVYFIQGYENWHDSEKFLHLTYKFEMKKIAISNWLKEKIDKYSERKAKVVYNGIDLNIFKVINKYEDKNKYSVAMIYHTAENKGCKYGINALIKLKQKYPKLEVNIYGAPERPKELPEWFHYTQNADEMTVSKILNNSAVFLCTSFFEGFGLPGLEAMACGTAFITTDCKGPREYCNKNNSIICKAGDENSIYEAIEEIFIDEHKIKKIINNGISTAKKWNIENSKIKFEKAILD